MFTQWIEDCVVQRVSLRDGLVLDLDGYSELVISRPLRLTLPPVGDFPAEQVLIDPNRVAVHERPTTPTPASAQVTSGPHTRRAAPADAQRQPRWYC